MEDRGSQKRFTMKEMEAEIVASTPGYQPTLIIVAIDDKYNLYSKNDHFAGAVLVYDDCGYELVKSGTKIAQLTKGVTGWRTKGKKYGMYCRPRRD